MIFGVVLAGGIGSRMNNGIPKQFINLNGKPIIIRTIEKLLYSKYIDNLIIVVHPDFKNYLNGLLKDFNISKSQIRIVDGGNTRLNSIENSINMITNISVSDDDIVVIHDAVRPFLSKSLIKSSIINAEMYGVCVATVPVTDTIYNVANGYINNFPDRSVLYNGQTPDSFKLSIIKKALNLLTDFDKQNITGTVQVCKKLGIKIKSIDGDLFNIKITTPLDLIIAEGIIRNESIDESSCFK